MNDNVKVSIIIPVYNTSKYLRQCLDTVCGQTLSQIQIICVDDGSTDDSVSILWEYAKYDSRVEIYHHKHTGKGAAGARNMGLSHAVGEYLLILDSDDYFDLDLAKKTYEKAKETDADIVIYNATYIDSSGKNIGNGGIINHSMLPDKEVFCVYDCPKTFFQITPGMAWSRLWKHSFIKENNHIFQSVRWLDDGFFTYTAMVTAKRICVLDERLVIYRKNTEGSQSLSKDEDKGRSSIEFYKELKKYLQNNNKYELLKDSFLMAEYSHYMQRLKSANSYENFKVIYRIINDGELDEILDNYKDDRNLERKIIEEKSAICDIKALKPEEFLYKRFSNIIERRIVFPQNRVEKNEKIVLYGAGAIGKSFLAQNMENQYCKIVGWVDRNYKNKGYPICAPNEIQRMDFDKIIIAIENEVIANTIKEELVKLGINQEEVIWEYPYEEG